MLTARPMLIRGPGRIALLIVILAAAVVSAWWTFLGSDTTYQVSAAGVESGPYEAPQIIACVILIGFVAFATTLMLPAWVVAPIVTITFTAAWSIQAASHDMTGLWAVGAIGVFVCAAIGSAAVTFSAATFRMKIDPTIPLPPAHDRDWPLPFPPNPTS